MGDGPASAQPICAFVDQGSGSSFYTGAAGDCAWLKALEIEQRARSEAGGRAFLGWAYETVAFYALLPVGGRCSPGTTAVHRSYNDRADEGDSNHRFTFRSPPARRHGDELDRRGARVLLSRLRALGTPAYRRPPAVRLTCTYGYRPTHQEPQMTKTTRSICTFLAAFAMATTLGCAATAKSESTGQYVDDTVITGKVKRRDPRRAHAQVGRDQRRDLQGHRAAERLRELAGQREHRREDRRERAGREIRQERHASQVNPP
jgi:hypothetical protein